jgi:hypothetical protein
LQFFLFSLFLYKKIGAINFFLSRGRRRRRGVPKKRVVRAGGRRGGARSFSPVQKQKFFGKFCDDAFKLMSER